MFVSNDEAIHNHTGSPTNEFTRNPTHNLFFNNGSDCDGCTLGDPNLFEDPLFVAHTANGDFTDDDFHIVADASPCVEAGTLTYDGADAPLLDFDGETRPIGSVPEIGIDEVEGPVVVDEEAEEMPDTSTDVIEDMATDMPTDTGADTGPSGGQDSGCGCSIVW